MATIQTIGTTGRDFSTLQAWEDAVPATPTGGYEGHCYNDSEFAAGVDINGHTTSGTNYIRLTAASGQSFQDHASKTTNPLFYDQSKGVGITFNDTHGEFPIRVQNDFVTIDRLQIKRTVAFYTSTEGIVDFSATLSNAVLKECIIAKLFSGTAFIAKPRDSKIINCLVYDSGATPTNIAVLLYELGTALNNTVVRIGTAGGVGITRTYTNNLNTAKGNAVFNWTTNFDSTTGWTAGSGFNCTNAATAPGSSNQVSKTFANQFVSTTTDFKLKTGADCINTGSTDATNAPNDIIGQVRGATTAGDIGAWEFVAAGGSAIAALMYYLNRQRRR